MNKLQVAADLRSSIELLETIGHTQKGSFIEYDYEGILIGYCIGGALSKIINDNDRDHRNERLTQVYEILRTELHISSIANWNDTSPSSEVLAKLHEIVDKL